MLTVPWLFRVLLGFTIVLMCYCDHDNLAVDLETRWVGMYIKYRSTAINLRLGQKPHHRGINRSILSWTCFSLYSNTRAVDTDGLQHLRQVVLNAINLVSCVAIELTEQDVRDCRSWDRFWRMTFVFVQSRYFFIFQFHGTYIGGLCAVMDGMSPNFFEDIDGNMYRTGHHCSWRSHLPRAHRCCSVLL